MEGTLQMLENVGGVYSLLDDDASPVAGIQLSNYTHPRSPMSMAMETPTYW